MNRAAPVAAIFAHPDDEVLGCGGALAMHARAGARMRILLLATGLSARGATDAAAIDALRNQARKAAAILGAATVEFADFPDNAMDTVALLDIVRRVEEFLAAEWPTTVYSHHAGDLNIDHCIAARAVATALRPLPGRMSPEILACEVNSSTEWSIPGARAFVPTDFLDISSCLDEKAAALACYADELRAWPHPRSIEGVRALARWRGAQAGVDAAEAYMLVRRIRI